MTDPKWEYDNLQMAVLQPFPLLCRMRSHLPSRQFRASGLPAGPHDARPSFRKCIVKPLSTFDRILASLYQAALDGARWPATAALIDEAVGAVGNALVVGEGFGEDVRICSAKYLYRGESRRNVVREYFDIYHPRDEAMPRLRLLPHGRLVRTPELYTEAELKTSPAYNEGLRRLAGQNGLNVRFDAPDGLRIVWGVGDPVGTGGWQSDQLELVERLLPHIRQCVTVRQALAGADAVSDGLMDLLDNRHIGVLHLDQRGRVVAGNPQAVAILRRGDGLFDEGGSLHARLAEDHNRLQALLARALPALRSAVPAGGSMTVRRPSGRGGRLTLHVSPVRCMWPCAVGRVKSGQAAGSYQRSPVRRAPPRTCAPAASHRWTPRGEFAPQSASTGTGRHRWRARSIREMRRFTLQTAWFVGVDWGSQEHHVCVTDAGGKVLGERMFEHGGAGLSEMADWLLSFSAGAAGDVGVAIETPRGPVVESLMEHGIAVHSINPKQLDRFRDRFSPAGAKDDRRDARVLASALRTDPHCFRRLEPTDPTIVELREWSRLSEELTRERVRLGNRMRQQLWRYYPQFLDAVDDDVAAPWALELWRRLPTPRAGQRVREVTLTRVLKQHRIRRIDAATLRSKLRAPAVKVAPGAVEAAVTHVELVAERLVLVNRQLDRAQRALDGLVEQLAETASADDPDASAAGEPASSKQPSDVAILLSVPGIGHKVVATLLAEGGDAVRRRDYDALRCLCGVAPVTKRSGKSLIVMRRLASGGRRPPAKRRLSLGSHCGATRSSEPQQVSGAACPRPRTRTRPALGGRSPARCHLRDAARRRLFRPVPRRRHHRVSRRVSRGDVQRQLLLPVRGRLFLPVA